jgi:hypothetical protein
MKTVTVILWSLVLALFWVTTSFAETGPKGGALDHFTQRSIYTPMQAVPTEPSGHGICDAQPDCADHVEHVEHSCQSCLYLKDGFATGNLGGRQFIETGQAVLTALEFARDILDPPRF